MPRNLLLQDALIADQHKAQLPVLSQHSKRRRHDHGRTVVATHRIQGDGEIQCLLVLGRYYLAPSVETIGADMVTPVSFAAGRLDGEGR